MSCAWRNPKCRIGMILGTGTNACYLEDINRVGTWDGDRDNTEPVIINTEWGAFGSKVRQLAPQQLRLGGELF